jgi:hypothetical protein
MLALGFWSFRYPLTDFAAAARQASAMVSKCSRNGSRARVGSAPSTSVCSATATSRAARYFCFPAGPSRRQLARRSRSWVWRSINSARSIRSSNEATVLGSLLMSSVKRRCVIPSFSSNVRITVNWSGVSPRCAIRLRNAWFKPYQARRNNKGSRRRSGASMAGAGLIFRGIRTVNDTCE